MENIDFASTLELLLGIAIVYFIVKSLLKSKSESNVIGHIDTPAPYKVEAPVTTVVEAPVTIEIPAPAPKTRARKDTGKKPAVKKAPAKKTAKKKPSAE